MAKVLFFFTFFLINGWSAELQLPELTSPVMDEAQLLSNEQRQDLSELARSIYQRQGPQITVLTVTSLQDYPIEEFSIRVAEKWKLGLKEKGNGLLIVIAPTEKKMRIEVGEGIEGEITDYAANKMIREILAPHFRQGDFYGGLRAVMEEIAAQFGLSEEGPVVRRAPMRSNSGPFGMALPFIIIFMILGQLFLRRRPMARGVFSGAGIAGASFFLLPGITLGFIVILFFFGFIFGLVGFSNVMHGLATGSGRGGRFGGGGFGGGGWGGGGGGFSGGGSSGSW